MLLYKKGENISTNFIKKKETKKSKRHVPEPYQIKYHSGSEMITAHKKREEKEEKKTMIERGK